MADITDVSSALVTVIAGIVYPNGTSQPSITGAPVLVYPGWPDAVQLRADLAAGKIHVSVFPLPNMLRTIDTAMSDWSAPTAPVNTVTLTLSGQTVTVGGTVSTPQNAALVVDNKAYVYAVQAGDTLASIATALAALVNADQSATAAGAVVTIPGAKYISPRVGGQGVAVRQTRRQEQVYQITVWANCFDQRDPIAAAIDSALSGIPHLTLADCSDSTTWATQVTFGLSEGIYMVGTGPAGDTIANATSTKGTAGIDSYAFKLLFGDWVYWLDTVNGVTRLVSPQAFVAGLLSNLSPQNSTLNKQIFGVVGTQKSFANQTYSSAELQSLIQAGIDLITNPVPGGSYFGCRSGHNSSSNALTQGDNYSRMTNYIASTINAGMGKYVGQLQSTTVRAQAAATLSNFLSSMEQQGMIGAVNGGPAFSVQIDANNNPLNRVALGYMQADVKVIYLSVIEKFLVNVEGSQATVIRTSTSNQ